MQPARFSDEPAPSDGAPPARPLLSRTDRWALAAARSWDSARLATALGDQDAADLLRDQARARARAAAFHRELARGWGVSAG